MVTNTSDTVRSPSLKPFITIWTGQAFSLLGSQLVQFALVWWLTKTTRSATMLALASLAALLPQILIGPFAGALVDRWSRRMILIFADTAIALATLVLALLFWLNIAAVWTIYMLLVIRATGAAFHWPAMQASTTLMLPKKHLSHLAGLNQVLFGAAGILIPPLGALAMEILPMQGILAIDVVTAIPAITALLFIAIPQPVRVLTPNMTSLKPRRGALPPVLADMREGLKFIWGWKALMLFSVIGIVVNMLGRAAGSLTPILITQHYQGGVLELGWWQSAVGIGSVIGGILLGLWGGFRRRVVTQLLALALDGLVIILIGLSPANAFLFGLGSVFFVGLLETIVIGLGGAIGQAIIPPEVQGRVFSLLASVSQGLAPLGLLIAGPFADTFGVRLWWVLSGIFIAGMGAGAFFFPTIVHLEDRSNNAP